MEIHYRTQHWSLRPVRDMSQEEEEEEEEEEEVLLIVIQVFSGTVL